MKHQIIALLTETVGFGGHRDHDGLTLDLRGAGPLASERRESLPSGLHSMGLVRPHGHVQNQCAETRITMVRMAIATAYVKISTK
jgi:hypothetical protein